MDRQIPVIVVIAMVILAGVIGYTAGYLVYSDDESSAEGIVDVAGRTVEVPDNLDNGIVTVGVDTLRFVSYFNLNDDVILVDLGDKSPSQKGKAYQYAYEYNTNSSIASHSHNAMESADVETIGALNPSLILVSDSVYDSYKDNCDVLAHTYTLVVINELSEDSFITDSYTLASEFVQQLTLLGQVFQMEDRANDLITGINGYFSQIREMVEVRTCNDTAYIAGTANAGAKDLDWTVGDFPSLELVNGTNAYTGSSSSEALDIGPEAVGVLEFDIVLLDPTSYSAITGDGHADSQRVLECFQNNSATIYVMMPYFWFGCNFDNVIANAYYLAYVLYDGIYNETAMMEYINGVYEFFYGDDGTGVFDAMDAFFTGNTLSLPLLTEVEVTESEGELTLTVVS